MLKKQNGLDNKTEAALITKDIIQEIHMVLAALCLPQ